MPVTSQPPPPDEIAGKSGGGLYLVGALVLIAGAVALFSSKSCSTKSTQQATAVTATATAPTVEAPVALYAPPPPPKLDEEDAGVDAGKAPAKSSGAGGPGVPGGSGPCGSNCSGAATGALTSALRGTANTARGCYNRALRNNSELAGSMTVSVQVGPSGQVCSASIGNDTVHSGEVSSCVLARYRGQTFPAPTGGCVTVNIPISFTSK